MKKCLIVILLLVVFTMSAADNASAWGKKKVDLDGIPLLWSPTTEMGEVGAIDLTGLYDLTIGVGTLEDNREDPALIGENRENADEGTILKVTTSDSVAEFVATHMKTVIGDLGIDVADEGAAAVITGEIKKFFCLEENVYQSEVLLKIKVAKDGETLWAGVAGGSSKRFGRSFKAENYNECLSDALLDAVVNLFKVDKFRQALVATAAK